MKPNLSFRSTRIFSKGPYAIWIALRRLGGNDWVVLASSIAFSCNPFVLYFAPRVLSEASAYAFLTVSLLYAHSPFIAGFFYGLTFMSKYYAVVVFPLILYYVFSNSGKNSRENAKRAFFFLLGSALPVAIFMAISWTKGTGLLAFFSRAGPELWVPLAQRKWIMRSIVLASLSPIIVSLPFTKPVVKGLKTEKKLFIAFTIAALLNFALGVLHMTGMTNDWRYKDHIRLATVFTPFYPLIAYRYFTLNNTEGKRNLATLVLVAYSISDSTSTRGRKGTSIYLVRVKPILLNEIEIKRA
jgi:hypothetical protein